jgi:hypothetical protein
MPIDCMILVSLFVRGWVCIERCLGLRAVSFVSSSVKSVSSKMALMAAAATGAAPIYPSCRRQCERRGK